MRIREQEQQGYREYPLDERGEVRVQLDAEGSVMRLEIGEGESAGCAELAVGRG